MSCLPPCSERTKRRKVAAEVSKVVAEAIAEESIDKPKCFASDNCDSLYLCFPDADFDNNNAAEACGASSHFLHECELTDDSNLNNLANLDSDDPESCVADCDVDGETFSVDFTDHIEWTSRDIEEFDNEEGSSDSETSLHDSLVDWATTYNICQNALSDLLKVLQPSLPELPKDARTLLSTQRRLEIKAIAGGEYYYFGIKFWLLILLKKASVLPSVEYLTLHANIDGIPLFKSSNTCLWPILCSVAEIKTVVFPAAVFCSSHKPDSVDAYLSDFISEIKALEQHGFSVPDSMKHYKVTLGAVICDAPARAIFKCIKGHNAYNSCERCVQHGNWLSKIIFPSVSAPLRTDVDFINRKDSSHHRAVSPFAELHIGMITNFPLDYMHLICLGVMRRMLHLWVHGPHACKLSHSTISAISDRMQAARSYIPREFSRKPRSLLEYKLWKATELRLFLVYTGQVILKGFLSPKVYSNFLDLSVAVRLLLSPPLIERYVDYADKLLKYFVLSFCRIYGNDQLVYNVHSLIHVADDARNFGALDNVSSFKYENFLGKLKKLVRRPQSPCTQIVRRLLEGHGQSNFLEKPASLQTKTFARPHMAGPTTVAMSYCQQYKQYNGVRYVISVSEGDNCFEVDGKIGLVRNILKDNHSCIGYVVFEEFSAVDSYFVDPLDSKQISIFFVSRLAGTTRVYPLADVNIKYVKLPFKDGFVVMPQMHFNEM